MGKKKRYNQPQTSSVESGAETLSQPFEKYTDEEIGTLTAAEVLEEIIAAHEAESELGVEFGSYTAKVDGRLVTIGEEGSEGLYTPEALEKFKELKLTPYYTDYKENGRFAATRNLVPYYVDAETIGEQHANTVMALASPYYSIEATTVPSEDHELISNAIRDADDAAVGHYIEPASLKAIREWFKNVTPVERDEEVTGLPPSLPEEEPVVVQDPPQAFAPEESESASQTDGEALSPASDTIVPEVLSSPEHVPEDKIPPEARNQLSPTTEIEEQPVETFGQPDVNPDVAVISPDAESPLVEVQIDPLTDGPVREPLTGEDLTIVPVSEVSDDSRVDELPPTTQEDSVTTGETVSQPLTDTTAIIGEEEQSNTDSTVSSEVTSTTTAPVSTPEEVANTTITEVAVGTEVATDAINAPKEENKDPNEFTVNSEFSPTVQLILSQLKDYTERMGIGIMVDKQTINTQQRRLNRLLVQILMTVNQKDFEDLMYETTNLFIEHRDRCFGKAYAYRGIDDISNLEMDSKERMRFYGLIDAFRGLADPTKHARLASNFAFSEILSTTPEQYAARFVLFCKKYCE